MILTTILFVAAVAFLAILLVGTGGFASAETLYVDDDAAPGGDGSLGTPYQTIQDAIDNATTDDTIRVFNGTYLENVVVNITLRIHGNASTNTTLTGTGSGDVLSINEVNSLVSNLTIKGSGLDIEDAGIEITADNCRVIDCNVSGNGKGIFLDQANSTIIRNATINSNQYYGTYLNASRDCKIINTTLSFNAMDGIRISEGSNKTTIMNCTLEGNLENGLLISGSNLCSISNSTFEGNTRAISLTNDSRQSTTHHTDFLNNTDYGIDASANFGSQINATQNWWGNNSGPYHPTLNPDGTGDNVTDDVLFDPWTGKQGDGEPKTLFVDDDATPGGNGSLEAPYQTIQEAVDNAKNGDTIRVFEGLYLENVVVDVMVHLIGNGSADTTINASESGDVVTITADYVNMSGFAVEGSGTDSESGIFVQANHTTIFNNSCSNNIRSIRLLNAHFNSIHNNTCNDNTDESGRGIVVMYSNNNTVSDNICSRNEQSGILVQESSNNTIVKNICNDNKFNGIAFDLASENTLRNNSCSGNEVGISLDGSSSNNVDRNNCSGNSEDGISFGGGRSIVWNNTCNENGRHGIHLYGSSMELIDNTCNNNGNNGIMVRDDYTNLTRCITNGNTLDGINATNVVGLNLIDCESNDNLQNGIFIDPSDTITITNTTITGNDNGLVLDQTTGVTVTDSNLSGNLNNDLVLTGSSVANLTNSTYATYNVELGSRFDIWWTFRLVVKDENGTAVEGARVYLNDTNTDPVFDGFTDANGTIPILTVQEGSVNSGSYLSLNPHELTILKDGLEPFNESLTIDSYQDLEYTLFPPAPGPKAMVTNELIIFIDEGEQITFDGTPSTGESLTFFWLWEDGSNYTLDATPPGRTYNKGGVFVVNLTVTDSQNRTDTLEIRVVVKNYAPYDATINGGNKNGDEDQNLTFSATAQDTASDAATLLFLWDFGDGQHGNGQNSFHTYTRQYNYTVILTVMDDDGATDVTSINVTITNRAPIARITPLSPTTIQPGGTVILSAHTSSDTPSDFPGLEYEWEFGDNSPTDDEIVTSHTYNAPGTYQVNLTVTDDDGATNTKTLMITVRNTDPVADAGEDIQAVKGENFTLDGILSYDPDSSGSIVNYTWDMGDGTILYGQQITYHFNDTGDHTIILVVFDNSGGESEADTVVVTILNDRPDNLSILASNLTIVQGQSINFTGSANDTDPITYSWDFGDGNTSDGMNVSHTFVHTGTLTVTLFVTDGMDEVNITIDVEVTNIAPNASFTPSLTEAAVDQEITFTAGETGDVPGEMLIFAWDFGDGSKGSGQVAIHAYSASGDFTVTLVVSDPAEDSDPFSVDITITNQPPTPRITLESNTTKVGETMVFDGSASSDPTDDPLTFTWDFGDGSSAATGMIVTHKFTSEGTYTVNLTVSDGTTEVSTNTTVTVTKAGGTTTSTGEGGGMGLITYLACGGSLILLILLVILVLFVTDKQPKEITTVLKMFKEGKTVKDLAPEASSMVGEAVTIEGVSVEGVEIEAVEAVVSGDAMEAALIAEVEMASAGAVDGEKGGKPRRDIRLIDGVGPSTAKKASYEFSVHKLERERDRLKADIETEKSEFQKQEAERQLTNVESKISKQSHRIATLEVEAEKERLRKEQEAKFGPSPGGAGGVAGGGYSEEFDPAAVEASIPKPESLAALDEVRNAIDRLRPARDNELERKQAELEVYADYADDPDYAGYVADLQAKVDAMETFVKRREKTGKGSGFPSTSEMAEWNEKLKKIKSKGKKGTSKKEMSDVQDLTPRIEKFEGMIGQSMDELLDELYAEAVEEIDVQIAEEEAAWEEAKAEAVAQAEEEFNARKAQMEKAAEAEAGKAAAMSGGEPAAMGAEAVEAAVEGAEPVEAEVVEAEAVEDAIEEPEPVEAEAVEAEAVEAEEVEVEAGEVEAEGIEFEGVEVEGVEIEGVEEEGVEIEGVEVEGVEIEGVEIGAKAAKPRAGKAAARRGASTAAGMKKSVGMPGAQAKPGASQVTCPQCQSRLAVGTDKRPLTFNCPKCSRQITLQATGGAEEAIPGMAAGPVAGTIPGAAAPGYGKPGAPPAAGSQVTCPRCRSSLNVATTQRPFTFNCPKCTQRITLQSPGMGGAPHGRPPLPPPGRYGAGPPGYPPQGPVPSRYPYGPGGAPSYPPGGPGGPSPTTINCPRCQSVLDISKMPRPSTFNCPTCRSRIEIR